MTEMTMRERILAVVYGRPVDRVPFVQYAGQSPHQEAWALLGRGNLGLLRWSSVHRVEHPECWREEQRTSDGVRIVLHTPCGSLVEERRREPGYGSMRITRYFVQEPEDYAALIAYFKDGVVIDDTERLRHDMRELGDDGVPLVAVGRTPFQRLWIEWVDLQELCYHLADCPGPVHECMHAIGQELRQVFEIVRRAPVDLVDFPDNITAPVIGEAKFRRYCVPWYDELASMLSERSIPVFVHMDGDLKPLWNAIGDSSVGGIDSLSPPPDNDTDPSVAHQMWPQMRLFVNFPSSLHLAKPERIYERAWQMLEGAGHSGRLQIQISENVPEGRWQVSYPTIVQAIWDFAAD